MDASDTMSTHVLLQRLRQLEETLAKEQELRNKLSLRLMGAHSTIKKLKDGASHALDSVRGQELNYLQQIDSHRMTLSHLKVCNQCSQASVAWSLYSIATMFSVHCCIIRHRDVVDLACPTIVARATT